MREAAVGLVEFAAKVLKAGAIIIITITIRPVVRGTVACVKGAGVVRPWVSPGLCTSRHRDCCLRPGGTLLGSRRVISYGLSSF